MNTHTLRYHCRAEGCFAYSDGNVPYGYCDRHLALSLTDKVADKLTPVQAANLNANILDIHRENEELKARVQELEAWKADALKAFAKSDVLHEALNGHPKYLGWNVYDAIVARVQELEREVARLKADAHLPAAPEADPRLDVSVYWLDIRDEDE